MNLYKIIFEFYTEDESEKGIKCLLLANSDKEVYDWIKSCPKIKDLDIIYCNWQDVEYEDENFENYIISNKGDFYMQIHIDDPRFGELCLGWELLKENVNINDYKELIDFGIVYEI